MKILLTAPPGVGKSTVIESVIRKFPGERRGIIAREVLDDQNKRAGFTLMNSAGESKQFMSYTDSPTEESVGGEFDVDVKAIDLFVVPELRKGLENPLALIYIDEIGRAQVKSALFLSTLRKSLKAGNNILGAIVFDDEQWSMEFKRHLSICILEVTTENRGALPQILLTAFENAHLFASLDDMQKLKVYELLRHFIANGQYVSAQKIFTCCT